MGTCDLPEIYTLALGLRPRARVYISGKSLVPMLQLLLNDLPISISSKIRLHADDVIIYRAILSSEDASILQEDLNKLVNWAATWLMSLNLNKCNTLVILTMYKIRDYPIRKVTSAKYLGVTISQNISWSKHIDIITCKANSILAFLQRNLSQCSLCVKSSAYHTVR